jgi:hypothetical protein
VDAIGELGIVPRTADTVMVDETSRARLAAEVVTFAASMG